MAAEVKGIFIKRPENFFIRGTGHDFIFLSIMHTLSLGSLWPEGIKTSIMNFFLLASYSCFKISYDIKPMLLPCVILFLMALVVAYTLNSVQGLLDRYAKF